MEKQWKKKTDSEKVELIMEKETRKREKLISNSKMRKFLWYVLFQLSVPEAQYNEVWMDWIEATERFIEEVTRWEKN